MMYRTGPLIAFCLIGSLLAADDTETTARQTRLAAMRQRAEALKLKVSGKPELRRVEKEPLFRYSDPTRTTTDGTLWLWTEAGRPLAAACLFNDTREGFQWNYECVSLSDSALFLDGRPGWNWRPVSKPRHWIRVTDPEPARSEAARLLQMKALLVQFHADADEDGNVSQLRLLPRQVLRYRSPDDKIEDGAMFLFVSGTNPEVLVQVEAMTDANRGWRISFARMAASRLKITSDDKTVWEAERIREWNPQHEYFSHYGSDRGELDQDK
ncbi:MAG: hypothetical protein JWP89_6827 [Schlesneria sp.]|nr:hypothetical protein [Schlesneria sp.]